MSLSAGAKLGPYLILEKIGAGGMGEVYRARDERLGRDVALKVSSEHFTERFEREAKLIASLNHHNICSLFDVGPNFLVMELIDGQTLAERIAEGPLPLEEALQIATQIADALQAAHDSGVIHRDLKPGNIKIKSDGTVKVLDFGLAKSGVADAASAVMTNSPTMIGAATQAGIILGTAAYMSPEQARGKAVDKRADIWSFGAVLYEMITGRQLFVGEDVSHTLASVIMKDPNLEEGVPAKVRPILKRCLEKDPKKRLRDISGVSLLLEQTEPAVTASVGPTRESFRIWRTVAIVALAAAIASALLWRGNRTAAPELKPLVRLTVEFGSRVSLTNSSVGGTNVLISPDGTRIAYVSQSRMYTRRLDEATATELPGTSGAFGAFFSPDSKTIAFFAGGKLKKISIEGGAILDLASIPVARGGTWTRDGKIIASTSSTGNLSVLPEGGGAPVPLTTLEGTEATHRWPHVLPGGKGVIYTAHTNLAAFDGASIKVYSFADGKSTTLHQGGTNGRVVTTSRGNAYLLFVSRSILFAEPFDLDKLQVTSEPVPVVTDVGTSASGAAEMDVSDEGTLLYRSTSGVLLTLQWLDAAGKLEPLIAKPAVYGRPAVAPDGQRVAIELTDSNGTEIYVYDKRTDNMSRLTFTSGRAGAAGPIWTPDGNFIIFQGIGGLYWIRSTGGSAQSLLKGTGLAFPYSISPDNTRLTYMETGKSGYDLWTLPIKISPETGITAEKPEPFLITDADERYAMFSPDGKWIAYSSTESGTFEAYVRRFPDNGDKWQISNSSGVYPMWSGQSIFFETQDAQMMMVAWSVKNNSFVPEKPQLWSARTVPNMVNTVRNYHVNWNSKRVAILMPAESEETSHALSQVTFLQNFFDELDRRIAPKK